jgi:hypothetical protein
MGVPLLDRVPLSQLGDGGESVLLEPILNQSPPKNQ